MSRMGTGNLLRAVLWVFVIGQTGTSNAQSPPSSAPATKKARALVLLKMGNQKVSEGQYLQALELYRKAYQLYPSPKLRFNIAQTLNQLGRYVEALSLYERFVGAVKRERAPKLWDIAHERIFKLTSKIGTVRLVTNLAGAEVKVGSRIIGRTPLRKDIRLLPGSHTIIITRPGYERQVLELTLKAGQSITRRVRLLTEEQAVANRKVVRRMAEEKRRAEEQLRRARRHAAESRRKKKRAMLVSGWTLLSAGVAAGVVSILFGTLGEMESRKVEEASNTTYWSSVRGNFRRAENYRKAAFIAAPFAGAMAVTGAVSLGLGYRLKERPAGKNVTILPAAGKDRLGFAMGFRF